MVITFIRGLITPVIITPNPKRLNPKPRIRGLITPLVTTHEPPSTTFLSARFSSQASLPSPSSRGGPELKYEAPGAPIRKL